MATEPSINSLVDASASATSESQPITAQNVDSSLLSTNNASKADIFDTKRIPVIEDQLNSADVSISGGSDSEAVRSVGAGPKDGTHNRNASTTKKLATFKAVNPNKSFLGAKAGSPVPAVKSIDRQSGASTPPTGSATLSSRPRLVAKTGSQKDGVSRLGSLNGGKPNAPSPQAVWNKNRPPEPKKFTDEELKNHGIHMASRLNENDVSGQNKWADIDDDDDDWAPEAITWGDGTKTNIPHPDEIPPEPANDPIEVAPGKPESPSPQVGLKLGSSGSGTKGLILKNTYNSTPQEKAALVAKPPAPQASKSPWAALPPVEKISPAVPPPPEQKHNPFRAVQKEYRDGPGPFARGSGSPPRDDNLSEDFGRQSWRDPSAPRELYNTQSGRYETVPDRRGSYHSVKPSAVLQRPHGAPGDYPAEPSPAFAATRNSHDPPYSRRRGSSIASANSGSFFQKKGSDLPSQSHDMLGPRRPSFTGSTESPISPVNKHVQPYGAARNQGTHWSSPQMPQATPNQGHGQNANMGPPPVPTQPQVDQVEYQKKLMKERQELARKRRQEEEAREEAARRERIQKKLDAMGPLPEKKSEKEVSAPADSGRPTHIQQRPDQGSGSMKPSPQETPQTMAATQESTPGAQPPTLPEATGTHAPPVTTPRRPSHGHGQEKRPNIWSGQGQRGDHPGWARGGPPPVRNVWGSPDIDRALGNGTFNPDLGRVPGAVQPPLTSTGPSPIGPPGSRATSQSRSQQQPAPIGSRPPPRSGTDLASQWVSAVVESDRALAAANRQRRNDRDAQLAEQGRSAADAQPTIQEAWRPVQLSNDGTRRVAPTAEPAQPSIPPWKGPRDELARDSQPHVEKPPAAHPGVIGSGSTAMMSQKSQQGRSSRFFPTQQRPEPTAADHGRSTSPTPPPPTMMGHPAYEGDASKPNVSLPKPQPIVKLPPMLKMAANQTEQQGHSFSWAQPPPFQPDAGSEQNWQTKIHNLFRDAKSPTKLANVDALSKRSLELHPQHELATVSLPSSNVRVATTGDFSTKPMAEECFEEQEMGSLPLIRIGHYQSNVPWQPVSGLMAKPFPRRLLTHPTTVEMFPFFEEITKGTPDMKIQLPGMRTPKIVAFPAFLASNSVSARGRGGRGGPRSRGSGRGKRDRDTSEAQSVQPPTGSSPTTSRGGRGSSGLRSRGGSWRGRGGSWRGRGGLDAHGSPAASSLAA